MKLCVILCLRLLLQAQARRKKKKRGHANFGCTCREKERKKRSRSSAFTKLGTCMLSIDRLPARESKKRKRSRPTRARMHAAGELHQVPCASLKKKIQVPCACWYVINVQVLQPAPAKHACSSLASFYFSFFQSPAGEIRSPRLIHTARARGWRIRICTLLPQISFSLHHVQLSANRTRENRRFKLAL
jgi:hypothetical protein